MTATAQRIGFIVPRDKDPPRKSLADPPAVITTLLALIPLRAERFYGRLQNRPLERAMYYRRYLLLFARRSIYRDQTFRDIISDRRISQMGERFSRV